MHVCVCAPSTAAPPPAGRYAGSALGSIYVMDCTHCGPVWLVHAKLPLGMCACVCTCKDSVTTRHMACRSFCSWAFIITWCCCCTLQTEVLLRQKVFHATTTQSDAVCAHSRDVPVCAHARDVPVCAHSRDVPGWRVPGSRRVSQHTALGSTSAVRFGTVWRPHLHFAGAPIV